MAAPAQYNLYSFASDIINAGNPNAVRLLDHHDSFGDLGVRGRMMVGYRDFWQPYNWSGWYAISAFTGETVVATPNVPGFTITPVLNTAAGFTYNHYDYATTTGGYSIGIKHQGQQSGGFDSATGSPATPNSDKAIGVRNNQFPHAYREVVFTGNVANDTILMGWSHDFKTMSRFHSTFLPATTATSYGNWTTISTNVRARLIYLQNTSGPSSLVWRTTRGGTTSNSTAFNANGATAITYVDADFATTSTNSNATRLYPQLKTDALGTNETGTFIPIIGLRVFTPSVAGLEIYDWAQSGFNLTHFYDTTNYDTPTAAFLAQWFAALDWPTHIKHMLGQNQTNTETTQLNAGNKTQFKADYNAMLDFIDSAYTSNGRTPPKHCLVSPVLLGAGALATSGRTIVNYTTMAQATYEVAQQRGCAFINLMAAQVTPMDMVYAHTAAGDNTSMFWTNTSTDEVHPNATGQGAGSIALAEWAQMQAAYSAGSGNSAPIIPSAPITTTPSTTRLNRGAR